MHARSLLLDDTNFDIESKDFRNQVDCVYNFLIFPQIIFLSNGSIQVRLSTSQVFFVSFKNPCFKLLQYVP